MICAAGLSGLLLLAQFPGAAMAIHMLRAGHGASATDRSRATSCTQLKNRGSHFTVEIEVGTPEVGTPPQNFDVVADTGSNAVIVNSCVCQDSGHCGAENKCFRGTGHSSTFSMFEGPQSKMPSVVMTFGSGQIQSVITTDVVRVGSVNATMIDQVFLMVNQALQITGPFEGILGLGLPNAPTEEKPADNLDSEDYSPAVQHLNVKGFLEMAQISRFSMCFNDGADGVLRLGTARQTDAIGSIGKVHWGLDFRGVSVGDVTAPVQFCTPESMQPGQATPCGAIPDSGTTLIMADRSHLDLLFGSICDSWERCKQEAEHSPQKKVDVLANLFANCGDWLSDGIGLDELPALHFHVRGSDGLPRTLKLPGSAYIVETEAAEVADVKQALWGMFKHHTAKMRRSCMPSFGEHKYTTESNGPVWILGTPFFYEFQVGYDVAASPPSVSFSNSPCGNCDEAESESTRPALFSKSRHVGRRVKRAGSQPRRLGGKIRLPSIDATQPL